MSPPILTVVIPTLDEVSTVGRCLDAIGTDACVEVVVSDGGSTDGTVDVVRAHGRAHLLRGPAGRGQQLRRGAAAATAARLLFLHADCRLPRGWLPAVVEALEDPGTALACFRLVTEPTDAGASRLVRAWLRLLDLRSLGFAMPYGDQGFAMRREVYEETGGFSVIPLMEDLVMARACRRLGRIRRIPLAVHTSSRRFDRHALRSRAMTATFPLLFRAGFPAERLARWYGVAR
jgi:rSAM/selenodomain-associated transferase 2